jgi:Carboxypeptidase regulatory-like domain
MSRAIATCILLALLFCVGGFAQPTGTIAGTIADESGAVVPNATVTITNKANGLARTATSNAEGYFSAPALPAGDYDVKAEVAGFRTLVRPANVQAGETTQVNMPMTLGQTQEVVTVEAATAQINYENHEIQGVVQHSQIEDLPSNGRQYAQLAALMPGVTVTPGSTAQFNTLFNVSILGAGNRTVFTIDGGNVSDNIDTAGGNSSMNFSQETVQEFQLSSVNFDLATPIASGGAINVVTRSGSNDWHGAGYFFFRDHNMAAYPALARTPLDPNPFFARRNPGATFSGPLKKDKLFFFFNYEYYNQVQALAVQGSVPSVQTLNGIFNSPYVAKQISLRFDYRLNDKNALFLRYSHDGNVGFGDVFSNGNPSNWVTNKNWADQSIIGLTSTITPNIVNDIRFQYNYWNNHNIQASPSACQFPCIGVSPAGTPIGQTVPEFLSIVGTNFAFGNAAIGPNVNAPQARNTRRFELVEGLSWQKGSHRIKFGGDLNPTKSAGLWGFCTPACIGGYGPEFTRATLTTAVGGPAVFNALFPTLPTTIKTNADLLNLPVLTLQSGIFTGIGVGSNSTPAPYNNSQNRNYNQYRAYVQDTWKITKNFTLNYGLGWNAQTGFYNSDLAKPAYLAPIYGANNLAPTGNNTHEMEPAVGFAWSPFKNNKTVIRGGGGIYWDSTPGYYKLREPAVIGPLGDGRLTLSPSDFTNIYPGILNFSAGGAPLAIGAPIPIQALTNMTVGQFMNILQQQLPGIQSLFEGSVPKSGPYTTTNVDVAKTGVEIYPPGGFPLARSYQTSIGIQHDFGHDIVLTADWARRQGENVSLGELDVDLYNRYIGGVQTPVIPACPKPNFTPGVECSNGPITQWTDEGRAVYEGMLVRVQKRMTHRYQWAVNYALQNENAQTCWNLLNCGAGYGPAIPRQNLGVQGVIQLPWHFQLSVNSSIISRSPVGVNVGTVALAGTDINGSQALPGLPYSSAGLTSGKSELVSAVQQWNSTLAGTKDSKGNTIPTLVIPHDYQFGDPTYSQDFRLTYNLTVKERYHFTILAEMFNAFNISNLSGYNFTLDPLAAGCTLTAPGSAFTNCGSQTYNFGQPTQRAFQTFGSGGPRAVQLGAKITF